MEPVLLAPAALALGALLLGPFIAHLTRRQPIVRRPFGAMMLLRRVIHRQKRRRRVDHPWVLLFRLLALGLFVLGLSQPELHFPGVRPPEEATGPVVVLLDNSLSMNLRVEPGEPGSETLLSLARSQAVTYVRGLPEGTPVACFTLGGAATLVGSDGLTGGVEAVVAAMTEVRQSYGGTDLVGGLSAARRLLAATGGRVVVFSDEAGQSVVSQTKSELELLSRLKVTLEPHRLDPPEVGNVVVTEATYGDGLEGGSVRFQLHNYGNRDVEIPVQVILPGDINIRAFVDVPAGKDAEQAVTVPRAVEGGVAVVKIDDPWLSADDAYSFHLPRIGASRVLVVDGDPGPTPMASEVYFLERALAPWGSVRGGGSGVLPDVKALGSPDLDPGSHRVVFLANHPEPGPLAPALLQFVRQGGGLFISVGDNVTEDRYNAPLRDLLPAALRRPRSLVTVGQEGIETELPSTELSLFTPFARGGLSGFAGARWTRLYTVDSFRDGENGVSTLMRTQSGLPLLIERQVGLGKVLLFTGTIDLDWGNFPLQASYMPWVQRLVSYLGGATAGAGLRLDNRVGDVVHVPVTEGIGSVDVVGPTGAVGARARADGVEFDGDVPGAYRVETPGSPALAWVAVNVDLQESDVRRGEGLLAFASQVDPERYVIRRALSVWCFVLAGVFLLVQAILSASYGLWARNAERGESIRVSL